MSWVETESLSFTARHDSDDSSYAERTLDRLEHLRLRPEDRVELIPEEVTIVVHTNPLWLTAAPPFPPPPPHPPLAARGPPLPPRRPLVCRPRRPPLPRRLADVDRAPRPQRDTHGTARRRRRLLRSPARHRRAPLRAVGGRRQQPCPAPLLDP